MKFVYYYGTRDGSLTPTKVKGDRLPSLVMLSAVNATKHSMYTVYDIIESYIVRDLARVSAHCKIVVIDDVESMINEIRTYDAETYGMCGCIVDDSAIRS